MIQVVIAFWEIAIASPVSPRSDFDAPRPRALAQAA
jgi:hypothetical protein